jgi:hypothetical protein
VPANSVRLTWPMQPRSTMWAGELVPWQPVRWRLYSGERSVHGNDAEAAVTGVDYAVPYCPPPGSQFCNKEPTATRPWASKWRHETF